MSKYGHKVMVWLCLGLVGLPAVGGMGVIFGLKQGSK